ncbi:MAG: hypothetical protein HOP02_01370 [Methylococcaceae bacterium]|nr:hypothetical protein [Methylococcaceae bacterium]
MSSCEITSVGLVIALFGLLFNNWKANERETRKEIRTKIDQLNQSLIALLDASKNYYLDEKATLTRESVKIHEAINTCDRLIEDLRQFKNGVDLRSHFYIIFDMVTGGDFESKNHCPGDLYAQHCKKISIQKEFLVKDLEVWFHKTYH